MERACFECVAAIDFNAEATRTFQANFPHVKHVLQKDLTQFPPERLADMLGTDAVDVIVGGPPCQAFSTARQVDGANHGSRVRPDKRRYLYRDFLDYVRHFQPKVFVMENVLGIQSAVKGRFFTQVQAEARLLGYRVHSQVEEAWTLGVPQMRRRQLIVGVRAELPGYFPSTLCPAPRAFMSTWEMLPGFFRQPVPDDEIPTLWDAIGDLPELAAGEGAEERDYDLALRKTFLKERGQRARHYLEHVVEISRSPRLTAHRARPHSNRDLGDFERLREGEHAAQAIARGEAMDFPYNRECFHDRYKRQHREKLCSTIVAHLSKDGLMFIHPVQKRSLTAREAARVQSFPDSFGFPVSRTHQFRLIGNAVPPLVGEAVGFEISEFLTNSMKKRPSLRFRLAPLPTDEFEAFNWLRPLLERDGHALRKVSDNEFKLAWYAIGFLYMGLHPDGVLDNGNTICSDCKEDYHLIARLEPRLVAPYFERSGWPVILAPIAREAWRRFKAGDLKDEQFYCSEAQMAGVCHRSPTCADNARLARAKLCA